MVAAALLLLASCTVREELVVDGNGSGTATLSINLHPIMISYYNDLLTAMTGVPGEYPVFDLEQLAAAFAEQPAVNLTRIERSARGQLEMELSFSDLNDVAESAGQAADVDGSAGAGPAFDPTSIFTFGRDGARREMTVRLDRGAVSGFLAFAPPESAMMTSFLLPPEDGSVSRDEYQDELAWALEEYASASEVNRVLENAAIEVVVRPLGRIESQSGGTIRGDSVVFRVPILEVLTLNEERVYSVVFVP